MKSCWPVLRRSYLSRPKDTRNAREMYLALSLALCVDSPSDYRRLGQHVLADWSLDVEEGGSLELKLVYALCLFRGLANPARLTSRSGGVSQILLTVLLGTRDPSSPLSILRRFDKILIPVIWDFCRRGSAGCIQKSVSALLIKEIKFPPPLSSGAHVDINMMPIIIGLGEGGLPEIVQRYFPLLCDLHIPESEMGEVMYLSVHESWVEPGATQRRGGLHVESPGEILDAELAVSCGYWGNG